MGTYKGAKLTDVETIGSKATGSKATGSKATGGQTAPSHSSSNELNAVRKLLETNCLK